MKNKILIINGFLGSGKTTLMNHILSSLKNEKVSILLNDYGKENIKEELIDPSKITFGINQGSLFCYCKQDQFMKLLKKAFELECDYILIESSGFSDPKSMNIVFDLLREQNYAFEILNAVTVIDAKSFLKLFKLAEVLKDQIKYSSVILLNKVEDISNLQEIKDLILTLNSKSLLYETNYCQIPMEKLLNRNPVHYLAKRICYRNKDFSSYTFYPNANFSLDKFRGIIKKYLDKIYRIKGKIQDQKGFNLIQYSYLSELEISHKEINTDHSIILFLFDNRLLNLEALVVELELLNNKKLS